MRIDQHRIANANTVTGSETKDPHSAPLDEYVRIHTGGYPTEPPYQPLNLLAIGDRDLDEVIHQDRLDYEAELRYEAALVAELRQQTKQKHLGSLATVHHFPAQTAPEVSPPSEHLAS